MPSRLLFQLFKLSTVPLPLLAWYAAQAAYGEPTEQPKVQRSSLGSVTKHSASKPRSLSQTRDEVSSVARLKEFLSGKKIELPKGSKRFPFAELFFPDGTWEGNYWHAAITIERGFWEVKQDEDNSLLLCTTTAIRNGKNLIPIEETCRTILPDYGNNTAIISEGEKGTDQFKVVISEIYKLR